jgi:peroxiredoxin
MCIRRLFLTVLSVIFIITFVSPVLHAHSEGLTPWLIDNSIGEQAPDFTLNDLSGKEVSLSSFRGKPVLLNFWATWCPYCRKEREELNSVFRSYKGKDLVIISVSIDRSVKTVEKFLERQPAGFINLTDTEKAAAKPYDVVGLPTTFLIDRNGIIRHKLVGFRKWTSGASKEIIDKLINR